MSKPKMDAFSYGGGVQSNAALVLAAQGKIDCKLFIFSNVGEDSEHPDTLAYVSNVAKPLAERYGIELVEVHKTDRHGKQKTIYSNMTIATGMSVGIPVRMSTGAPARRSCTVSYKIEVISKYLKTRGFKKGSVADMGIGFSTDEIGRMGQDYPNIPNIHKVYPLINLQLSRNDCHRIIQEAGLPQPPKSACWFCPYSKVPRWKQLKKQYPDLFDKAVALEQNINDKRERVGKNKVWLTRFLLPLDEVVTRSERQLEFVLEEDEDSAESCKSGHCWT